MDWSCRALERTLRRTRFCRIVFTGFVGQRAADLDKVRISRYGSAALGSARLCMVGQGQDTPGHGGLWSGSTRLEEVWRDKDEISPRLAGVRRG
jgi:hypothetical protein